MAAIYIKYIQTMKNFACLFFIILIVSCGSKRNPAFYSEQNKQVQYLDSIQGYSFTRSHQKINFIQLHFLKQFKDTIEVYLNDEKIDSFYKNDYHYDKNGEEYIIQDELPEIKTRSIELQGKAKNVISLLLKPSNVKISFEIIKGYDNYLVSHYRDYWYFTGSKSKVNKTAANPT